jgi:hypothetical protein
LKLNIRLSASDILANKALCLSKLHKRLDDSHSTFDRAILSLDPHMSTLDRDAFLDKRKLLNSGHLALYEIDLNVFRPCETKLKATGKIDYLGSATVVATVNEQDTYAGFSGNTNRKVKEHGLMK